MRTGGSGQVPLLSLFLIVFTGTFTSKVLDVNESVGLRLKAEILCVDRAAGHS